MQFPAKFSKILSKTLSERELSLLPKEFSLVGGIISVNLDGNLESRKKEIGMAMLKMGRWNKLSLEEMLGFPTVCQELCSSGKPV